MKISNLIENLKEYKEKYGDLLITCNEKGFFVFLINGDHFDIQEKQEIIENEGDSH